MASEVGSAYLTIIPSFQGGARAIASQLDGHMGTAGVSGGAAYAGGMGRGASRSSFLTTGGAMGLAFAGAFAASGLADIATAVKDYLGAAIDSASSLAESQSKAGQIFGDGTDQVLKFAQSAASRLGQSQQTALDGASTFGIFGKAAGLAGSDLAGFSTDLVTLAADLASFNNTTPEQAIEAIGAALRGESEPIRAYGVLLDDATLKARAMALGIYDGTGTLTQQQRVLAAHAEILAQTSTQQGDFARTSDGLANSQRIMNAEMANLQAQIGTALLPVVTDLFSTFSEWGLPLLQEMAAWFSENGESVKSFILGAVDAGLLFTDVVLGLVAAGAMFYDGMLTAFIGVARAVWVMADQILIAAQGAFGWMPGIGPKLAEMRYGFDLTRAAAEEKFRQMGQSADNITGGIGRARDSVQQLRDKVSQLNGMTAKITIKQEQQVTVTTTVKAKASGGPVVAGRPYLVGEMGPEIVVPATSGSVVTASQTARALGGGGGGPSVLEVRDVDGALVGRMRVEASRVQSGQVSPVGDGRPSW